MGREQCVSSGEAVVSTDGLTHTRRRIQGALWYPWIRGTPGYAVPLDTTVPLDTMVPLDTNDTIYIVVHSITTIG